MAIQSASLETTTLISSNAHPKRRSQLRSSIASAPSAPAAPESFDATQVTSSSVKSRVNISNTSPYSSKALHAGFSTGGNTHIRMLISEDFWNRSPSFCALFIREETPSPLPVGGLTDGLPKIIRQNCVVVAPGYRLILLLPATGGPALPGRPSRLGVSYQSHVETPLPEVHPLCYSGPDLSGPTDARSLR